MNPATDFRHLVSSTSLSDWPRICWEYYLEYLWFYETGSWVARIASTFRVMAFILIIPMIAISLLDITSYLIARTLGIVDDVKASTSDKKTIHNKEGMPSIVLQDTSSDTTPPSPDVVLISRSTSTDTLQSPPESTPERPQGPPLSYFASSDVQLQLSGEGVFSPAVSTPSSPKLTRRHLRTEVDDA